ncbi:hypothetical protein QR312_06355 [Bacillus atrophaeus]|nr:hypothetical protein [Bacillus atrophaeus]MDL5141533.1 hypothetical protein [Bacillus atrophaeus]
MPEDSNVELSSFYYYEKLDDEYKRLEVMPITDENDCLGFSKKTPDYEEAKGKETTLMKLLLYDLNKVAACIVEDSYCDFSHFCRFHSELHAFFH